MLVHIAGQGSRVERAAAGEHEVVHGPQTVEVRASIDRKIEEIRVRHEQQKQAEWEALSDETKAAWERFEELKARDLGAGQLPKP